MRRTPLATAIALLSFAATLGAGADARAQGRTAPTCYAASMAPAVFRGVPANIPRFEYGVRRAEAETGVKLVELAAAGPKEVALRFEDAPGKTRFAPVSPLTVGVAHRLEWNPFCNEVPSPQRAEFSVTPAAPFPAAFGVVGEVASRPPKLVGYQVDYHVDIVLDPSFAPWEAVFRYDLSWDGAPPTYTAVFKCEAADDGGRALLRCVVTPSCQTKSGEPASTTKHVMVFSAQSAAFDDVFRTTPIEVTLSCPSRENERPSRSHAPSESPSSGASSDDGGCTTSPSPSCPAHAPWLAFTALLLVVRRRANGASPRRPCV